MDARRPGDRRQAFDSLAACCEAGAHVAFAWRDSPDGARGMHPVEAGELPALAQGAGGEVVFQRSWDDLLGRDGIAWTRQVVRLP